MSTGRFTFRLQRLLALRHIAERAAAVSLGSAQTKANAALAIEARIVGHRAGARAAMLPDPGEHQRVAELRQAAFLVEQLDAHVAQANLGTAATERQVRAARERLGERISERRILERLRERHFDEWSLGAARHDRDAMDAIARSSITAGAAAISETTTHTES